MSTKKKYSIHLIYKACQIPSTFNNQSHHLHIHSPVFISLMLTLNIPILFTAIHNTLSSVSSIALDIQHLLKPFTVTSGEMHCHAVMIHTD